MHHDVKLNEKIKNVHFFVDTGSPKTYICKEVLDSLHIQTNLFSARINNRTTFVIMSPSTSHFVDINVIGIEYFVLFKAILVADLDEM